MGTIAEPDMNRLLISFLLVASGAFAQVPLVGTISNLVARPTSGPGRPAAQPLVLVSGAYEPGDWIPRIYRWDYTNALPPTADNFDRVGTNAIGRWVYDAKGEIGAWSVADIAARDNINFVRRYEGMTVYVRSIGITYKLEPGLNSWTELPSVNSSQWNTIAALPTQAEVFQKVSTHAVPLTLRSSSSEVLSGFTRNSEAFDPNLGSHVSSNVLRAFPLVFGAKFGQAVLIERPGTNFQYAGPPQGQLTAVRLTISTNVIPGPFGTSIPAIAYTDTSETNSHYAYYDQGPANNAPVHFGILFRPNNLTNVQYQMFLCPSTNTAWSVTMTATLDGLEALPETTRVVTGPMTYHDGGYVRLERGWYYGWMTLTITNATPTRAYLAPGNFLAHVGRTTEPAFYTAGYNYSSTPTALETPIYPMSKTNLAIISSKPQDAYAYTILQPIKSGEGTMILWLKNGFKQPTNATLIESGGFRVEMTRAALSVTMPDQGSGVSLTASVPQLSTFGERLVTLTWATNGLRAFVDGALVGASSPPTGAFGIDYAGVIGRASADTNHWNGHIAAAYLGTTLTDDEVAYLPKIVGPPDELETFKSLASRSGDEGADSPIPLSEVVWSPRFMGEGNYPYTATNKAKELHATASLWVYFSTNDTRVAGLKAVTPLVGGAFTPDVPTTDASALMIDFVTGQSMKPSWYAFAAKWLGCVNRPTYKQAVINYLAAYRALGIDYVQHDDPVANHDLALPFLAYRYGTGNSIGTLSSPTRGCFCPDCQASAAAIGYGTLTTANLRGFHSQAQTNYWQWLGGVVRSNANMRISANLSDNSLLFRQGYQSGRFHFGMFEQGTADSYPDELIERWSSMRGLPVVTTFAVNTLSNYEDNFAASDRTRRWMAGSYAMGFLPILPWDVYAGDPVVRTFAGRASIVDISGFVRSKGDHLLRSYDLAGAVGDTRSIPADTTVAAWASTNQVLVTVRHRDSDNRRVIHCVDFRDTPEPFTLSYWTPIVGNGAATIYRPATYNVTNQDYAVATGDFTQLSTSSEATLTVSNSVASIALDAGLWRIIEVQP